MTSYKNEDVFGRKPLTQKEYHMNVAPAVVLGSDVTETEIVKIREILDSLNKTDKISAAMYALQKEGVTEGVIDLYNKFMTNELEQKDARTFAAAINTAEDIRQALENGRHPFHIVLSLLQFRGDLLVLEELHKDKTINEAV